VLLLSEYETGRWLPASLYDAPDRMVDRTIGVGYLCLKVVGVREDVEGGGPRVLLLAGAEDGLFVTLVVSGGFSGNGVSSLRVEPRLGLSPPMWSIISASLRCCKCMPRPVVCRDGCSALASRPTEEPSREVSGMTVRNMLSGLAFGGMPLAPAPVGEDDSPGLEAREAGLLTGNERSRVVLRRATLLSSWWAWAWARADDGRKVGDVGFDGACRNPFRVRWWATFPLPPAAPTAEWAWGRDVVLPAPAATVRTVVPAVATFDTAIETDLRRWRSAERRGVEHRKFSRWLAMSSIDAMAPTPEKERYET